MQSSSLVRGATRNSATAYIMAGLVLLESRMPRGARFLRDNAFLVAAFALPVAVVLLFLVASVIPRWTVPPPAYDLVLRAAGQYDPARRISVEFAVRDGRIEATVRPLPMHGYPQIASLVLVEHATMNVREIPVPLPATMAENDPPQTIVVEALAGRRVLAQAKAPDGYEFEVRTRRGPGLVGEILFGMNRYDQAATLVNRGRVVPIVLARAAPGPSVGWLVDGRGPLTWRNGLARSTDCRPARAWALGRRIARLRLGLHPSTRRPAARAPGVLGVLGGIFVFAGVGVFIALQWNE